VAVAVQPPGVAEGVARVRVTRAGAVELNGQRRRAGRRRAGGDRRRRLVCRGEGDPADRAAVEVGVEQVAAGDLELHRVRRAAGERLDVLRVGELLTAGFCMTQM
jgi:hypothetical protein